MGSGRGKQQRELDAASQRATTAYNEYTPDPLETARRERTSKLISDFDSGKDIKDISGMSSYYNLFNSAKDSQANQMVGRGAVALGTNSNAAGQVSDMDKYVQAQREQDAAGMLYNASNAALADAKDDERFLINTDQNRKANRVGIAQGMYNTQLNRPQKPSFWGGLASFAIGGAQAAGSMGL